MYHQNNVNVVVNRCDSPFDGSPITRSDNNYDYYELSASVSSNKNTSYTMYVETFNAGEGVVVSKSFTQDLELFSTSYYFNGKEIKVEYSGLSDYLDIDTSASRQEGEKYKDCVKRVHKTIKDAAEENYGAQCDMVSLLVSCGTLAAICAVVECNEYGDDF